MARFFVDANTVISALLYVGNEARLLEYARLGLCELVTNEHVREEVRRFLERQPTLSSARRGQAMSRLARRFQESGCDFLVTGDRALRQAVPRAITTRQGLRRIEAELRAGGPATDAG